MASNVCHSECGFSPTFRSIRTPSRYSRSGLYDVCRYSSSGIGVAALMSATLAPGSIALVHFRTLARNVPNSTPEVRMVKTFAAGILGASLLLAPIFAADDQAKKPRNDGMSQDMREAIAFEHFKDAAAARQARIEAKNPSVTN